MEGKGENLGSEPLNFEGAAFPEKTDDARRPGGRSEPSWRAWVLSIIAAVVLSIAATLIFGGSIRPPGASNAAAGRCGGAGGGPCCPAQTDGEK